MSPTSSFFGSAGGFVVYFDRSGLAEPNERPAAGPATVSLLSLFPVSSPRYRFMPVIVMPSTSVSALVQNSVKKSTERKPAASHTLNYVDIVRAKRQTPSFENVGLPRNALSLSRYIINGF